MSLEFIFDQLRAAVAGLILGALTAAWFHVAWQRWNPPMVRFWGTWYTDSRLLTLVGILLVVMWIGVFLTS